MSNVAIGIDLGTTYSCVGVWQHGSVKIIANDQGSYTTPSYVAFSPTSSERLVGESAKNQAAANPTNTIFDAKRLIGRNYSDENVAKDKKHWPFSVFSKGNDKPYIRVKHNEEEKELAPEEISSMVLAEMKRIAESYLGHKVTKAVITVPAYFNDGQRQSTKDAAVIAGLEVLRIINEPTAAAIAYGLDKKLETEKNVLIFDLGGGTFDVSLLVIEGGLFEVMATGGNTHLGGEDFDNNIVEFCVADIKKKHKIDISVNPRALRRLRTACEKAKRTLSSSTSAIIEIDALHEGLDYNYTLTRAKFEDLNLSLFKKTLEAVENVIRDAKIDKSKVDEIVLVGGSTRIPKVQSLLQEFFGGKELNKSINPDEAVAYGAAVQAAILTKQGDSEEALGGVVLLDLTPLTLGIEVGGKQMQPMIPRNSRIPITKKEIFTTYADNQPAVTIRIFEGERPLTLQNNLLGNFNLEGIQMARRGVPQIEVSFDLDANGILAVNAKDLKSDKTNKLVINNTSGRLSKDEIERMVAEAKKYADEDMKVRDRLSACSSFESYCYQIKSTLEESKMQGENADTIRKLVDEGLEWLENKKDSVSKEELESRRNEINKIVEPLLMGMYKGMEGSGESGVPTVEDVE